MVVQTASETTARGCLPITELAFHGIDIARRTKAESVTHVSGTSCYRCLGPLKPTTDHLGNQLPPTRVASPRLTCVLDSPFIILFEQDAADEVDVGISAAWSRS